MGRIAGYYVSDVSKKKDSLYRLQTFYNYFRAIDEALSAGGLRGHQMIVKEMKAINGSPTRSNALSDKDKDRLRQSLLHSWNSRIFLHQYNVLGDDFIALSLQWLPTMYYYALYQSLQAYFRAAGKSAASNHAAALAVITTEVNRFPGFLSSSCSQTIAKTILSSSDARVSQVDTKKFSNLSRPDQNNCHQYIAKFLVTTRDEILENGYIEKRKKLKRKNLNKTQKLEVDSLCKPTSIFHFFYRVRKRFNYEEGDIIHQGDSDQVDPKQMYLAMKNAYSGMIVAVEWLTAQYAGKNNMLEILEEFKKGMQTKISEEQIQSLEAQVRGYF